MQSPILSSLNTHQQDAVCYTEGPSLILAGAGSGKTRVLTHKVAYLIREKSVDPTQILMVTFTNKAAGEMKKRITELLGVSPSQLPMAGTFHSICARILRLDGPRGGIGNDFIIYDTDDQLDAIKTIMKEMDISTKNFHPNAILKTISEAKNELIGPLEYPQYARGYFQETVAKIYISYQQTLRKNTALDFDDLIMETVKLFMQDKTTLVKYQEQFHYILVDEYQDTNHAQYSLTKLLSGRYKNITVVGDASQSIYRFRGADFTNIVNFKTDFPHAKEFHLERNYRSTQTILDGAYAVISKNRSHPILKLWTEKSSETAIELYEAQNEKDEAGFIITSILQSGQPYSDFAVLYRTNAQSRAIEEAMVKAAIPYQLVGGTKFYERKEIKDVIAYLRLILHPHDSVSRVRAEKIGKGRLTRFLELQEKIHTDESLIALTTLEILDRILDATRYTDLYDPRNEEESYRLENIKELRSVAMQYPSLIEFLETVALLEKETKPGKTSQKPGNAVTLMTLHSAKGLEFSDVFIIGMEEGLFPHSRALMEREELEEERRLCYVGITRAKNRLTFTYARQRLYFGSRITGTISRFMADIPESILHRRVSIAPSRGFYSEDLLI